jgi:HEAT repeat protein
MRAALALLLAAGCLHRPGPYTVTVDLDSTIHALGSEDLFEQDDAVNRVLALGASALPALAVALEREPPEVRAGVVEVLGKLAPSVAAPLLLRAATDPADDVRYDALQMLGPVEGEEPGTIIEQALADPNPKIRLAATRACARKCSRDEAIDRLVDMALTDPLVNATRARAVLAAMMAGHDERAGRARGAIAGKALPRLRSANSLEERARAALLAVKLGNGDALEPLLEAAREADDLHLRLQALYAIGQIGDRDAVPTLADLLRSNAAGVRSYSYDALRRLVARGVREAERPLASYRGVRPDGPLPEPGS